MDWSVRRIKFQEIVHLGGISHLYFVKGVHEYCFGYHPMSELSHTVIQICYTGVSSAVVLERLLFIQCDLKITQMHMQTRSLYKNRISCSAILTSIKGVTSLMPTLSMYLWLNPRWELPGLEGRSNIPLCAQVTETAHWFYIKLWCWYVLASSCFMIGQLLRLLNFFTQ